jgi:opacity protein-like surface antigen
MRKAILGAASALALASPAVAADLQVTPYSKIQAMSRKFPRTRTGQHGHTRTGLRRHTRTGLRRLSL